MSENISRGCFDGIPGRLCQTEGISLKNKFNVFEIEFALYSTSGSALMIDHPTSRSSAGSSNGVCARCLVWCQECWCQKLSKLASIQSSAWAIHRRRHSYQLATQSHRYNMISIAINQNELEHTSSTRPAKSSRIHLLASERLRQKILMNFPLISWLLAIQVEESRAVLVTSILSAPEERPLLESFQSVISLSSHHRIVRPYHQRATPWERECSVEWW